MQKETKNGYMKHCDEVKANDGTLGTIVAIFTKNCGGTRMVVEDKSGRLEIFTPQQLTKLASAS